MEIRDREFKVIKEGDKVFYTPAYSGRSRYYLRVLEVDSEKERIGMKRLDENGQPTGRYQEFNRIESSRYLTVVQ